MTRERLVAEIDDDLKQLIDADPRANRQVTEVALWREFGGRRKSAVEMRIEHKNKRLAQIDAEIEDLRQERAEVEAEKDALEGQLQEMEEEASAYEQDCDELLNKVSEGELPAIIPVIVEDVAKKHGKEPEEVVEDCKQRALEQKRDMMTTQFMTPKEARGLASSDVMPITEAWGGADE